MRPQSEIDPMKRAQLLIKCNDLVIDHIVVIPMMFRFGVAGVAKTLHASLTGWDNDPSNISAWYKDTNA